MSSACKAVSLHLGCSMRSIAAIGVLVATLPLSAFAKNEAQLHVADEVIRHPSVQQLIGKDLRLVYGVDKNATHLPAGALLGELQVEGRTSPHYQDGPRRFEKGDLRACREAMRTAIGELVLQAKRLGANALIDVQSSYEGHVLDHDSAYECHVGYTRVVVGLRAKAVRTVAAAASKARFHAYAVPADTGFAAPTDIKALPLSESGQAGYEKYLGQASPKAFVIMEDGSWRYQFGHAESMALALQYCARQGKTCWLYAVDDRVVWQADPARRIGSLSQLRPARVEGAE